MLRRRLVYVKLKNQRLGATDTSFSTTVKTRKSFCPQQVVFCKPADYKCKLADYSKVVVYKCKLVDYSKVAVYKCKLLVYTCKVQYLIPGLQLFFS